MKYIYGLSLSGESIVKYCFLNNLFYCAWDDNEQIRNKIIKTYSNIKLIHPAKLDWDEVDEAFISPGINLKNQLLVKAKNNNISLYRDLELYSKLLKKNKIIAVTGTNGKSTTVKLIGDLLKKNRIECFVGGNLGTPLMDYFNKNNICDFHVIELSSFQLEAAPSFKSYISILLNISNDHQDRYNSMIEYAYTKEKIFNSKNTSYGIISIDDDYSRDIFNKNSQFNNKLIPISTNSKIHCGVYINNGKLYDNYFDKKSLSIEELSFALKGKHNLQNILAAYVVNKILNLNYYDFKQTIKNYIGLPHRFEYVFENDKLLIINNSKATNFDSSIQSIENFNNIFLILGGKIKNKDFSVFSKVKNRIVKCFIIGESTEFIFNQVSNLFVSNKSFTMEKAINQIFKEINNFDSKSTILLAPACSSFDHYINFEERGIHFKDIIMKELYNYEYIS